MAKHGLRGLLDTLFPVGEGKKNTTEMIERGLEALRAARDARGVVTGNTMRVPSRLELRLSQTRYDELAEMGAVRDIEIYFNDEMMKDLSVGKMKTFADHPVYITIGSDASLGPNEIYAAVLPPEDDRPEHAPAHSPGEVYDRTSVLGEESVAAGPPAREPQPPPVTYRLVINHEGKGREVHLEGRRWVIGRRGASGLEMAEGYRKIDIDFATTVSREQVRVDLIGSDRLRIERIGKGPMHLEGGEELQQGDNRLLPLGARFYIENTELAIVAR